MILKDMYCSGCECIAVDVAMKDCDEASKRLRCDTCKGTTVHLVRCNGGAKSRYRFCDWDGASGHVEWVGDTVAEYGDTGTIDTTTGGSEIRGTAERTAEIKDRAKFNREGPKIRVG